MSDVKWISQITAYDVDKLEEFKLILNANEIISIAEYTFEIFDEETGNWVEHEGCEVYENSREVSERIKFNFLIKKEPAHASSI